MKQLKNLKSCKQIKDISEQKKKKKTWISAERLAVEVNVERDGYFEMKWVSSGSLMSHLVPSSFSSVWGKRAREEEREREMDC